jgi:hypothetical protein
MMLNPKVFVALAIAAAATAGVFFYSVGPQATASDRAEDDVLESLAEEQAENGVLELANSAPEVKALTDAGYQVNTDIVEQNGSSIVTKSVLQKGIIVTGDYKTGYTMTFPGTQEATSIIEDGRIISTSVTKARDVKQTQTYTEDQIRIIETGTSVPGIKEYLAEHAGDTNVIVSMSLGATGGGNYDCPEGGCVIVFVQNFETGEILRTLVNPETNQVLKTFDVISDGSRVNSQ